MYFLNIQSLTHIFKWLKITQKKKKKTNIENKTQKATTNSPASVGRIIQNEIWTKK
jgi:hypothetical protein